MASLYRSIFKRDKPEELTLPSAAQPVMRVLEPRVLLDAAAVETALDIAGQAVHSQLADDYLANVRSANPLAPEQLKGESGIETEAKNKQVDDDDETSPENAETENLDREIIFIDAGVDDKDSLIASLEPGVSVHILDAKQDGVQQIADILSNGESYSAVHIFSHGQSGQLQLGNTTLDINSMRGEHRLALRSIGNAIDADGDLLLYGCDFGDGTIGQQAARELSFVTGADIAASDDLTGAASLAGDWDLEVQVGSIQAQAYSLPEWQGILANFEIEATAPPVVSHQTSGIIGTVGTQATWVRAVTHTPGGGPTETYDIRATIIGASGEASATFETTTANPTSPDDIRVVVTNVGAVTHQEAGQDVLEEGSVTVIWEIFETGTTLLASSQSLNLVMQDLDGLAGLPQTIEGISLDASEVATYTTEAGSNLTVFGNEDGINVQGTVDGNNDPNSKIGFDWVNVNQFILTYQTYTQTNAFDMDGDGDVTFAAPVVTVTQSLDLDSDDSSGATNDNYQTVYFNGLPAGPINDVPVAVADLDISIFDISDIEMESATITLTNSSAGDQLNIDTALLSSLGITGTVTGTPPGSIVVDLDGYALTSNYETAIKSITYENTNPDGTFDRTFARIITVDISDGLISTTGAQTVISFGTPGGNPVAGSNIYAQDEDNIITATAGTGLLSDDMDPEGDPITVLSAMASNGDPIAIGSATTLPSGASITLNADGSFTYAPVAHYSGVENITYTITDGALTSTSWASFDIQPVVDVVSLTVLPLNPTSDEDIQSSPVVVTVMSPDVSETQIVIASNIPIGVVLTDGTNEFTSSTDTQTIEITDWNLNQLRILPVQNSDLDVGFLVTAVNSEVDGSQTFQTLPVTFVVDAVADEPLLIVQAAGGPVDGDVDLSLTIQPTLFDTDGSEQLTAVQISQIPVGAQMLVSGVPQTIVGGSVTINPADIANLVFRPPVTGLEIIYNMEVRVTATEVSPENGVTLASATRGPVTLTIDLNNNDDPVFANDDVATTFTGETVTIDALQNDYVPDGGEFITLVEGQPVGGTLQVVLAGGEGVVELDALDRIVFTATAGFTGEAVFQYTVQDVDGSTDTADITVTVLPRWIATAQAVAVEGGATQFQIGLEGNVAQNSVISTEIRLADIDTTSADYGDFVTAVNDSITNLNQDDFSFDGTVLTYTTPVLNYDAVYDPTGSTFTDISGVGTPLGLGDDGISPILLGFDFDFYGDTFSNAYVSANGYLTFGSPVDDPNNDPLDGSAFGGRPAIAGSGMISTRPVAKFSFTKMVLCRGPEKSPFSGNRCRTMPPDQARLRSKWF